MAIFQMEKLEAFRTLLTTPKRIVITTHAKPDADALGSSLGLAGFLKKKHHQVTVITPTDYPEFLEWMEGNNEVIVYNQGNQERSARLVADAEMIFNLDFSSLHRIDGLGDLIANSSAMKVMIDHHTEPDDFADFELWSTEAAATAELLYVLMADLLNEAHLIDEDIAEALYAGIMTDTGSFKHPNTTRHVHEVVADLIERGANSSKVSKLIYDTNSLDRIRFLGFALSEKLVVLEEYKTAFFAISARELQRFSSKTGDTEGLVNYALSIKGVVFAAVIIDRVEAVKMSFRSIGNFSVSNFAKENFEGGGHKNAAGGKSHDPLNLVVDKFLSLLPKHQEEILNAYNEFTLQMA